MRIYSDKDLHVSHETIYKTRYVMLVKVVSNKTAASVIDALIKQSNKLYKRSFETGAVKCLITKPLLKRPIFKCTFAVQIPQASAVQMKIPIVYCANTSQKEQT